MDDRIKKFIKEQTVATICCVDEENNPYCFSCFYAFDEENGLLYYKSHARTHHYGLMKNRFEVAGTIQPDKLNKLAIKGVQLKGFVDETAVGASDVYHKKYPFALAMKGEVWTVKLTFIKMTDNTIGIGKKIIWELESI